ncbi:MAG: bifunctional diguanylate cyclase/phosphodiesterase [Pseudomonadota bacterium]
MTYLRRRQLKYFGGFAVFVFLAGMSSFWFTHSFENTFQKHVNELHSLAEIEVLAVQTQYFFKKQVYEWKNILLRGHVQADFDKHSTQYEHESKVTETAALALVNNINENSEAKELAERFILQNRAMNEKYLGSLEEFRHSGFDFKTAERLIRDVDTLPTVLLDQVVKNLSSDIQKKRDNINQKLIIYVASYGLSISLILGICSLVFVRLVSALIRSSLTDKTTNTGNRDLFVNLVTDAIETKTPVTVALLDINNFKLINEAFGSSGGDRYLSIITNRIKDRLTKKDAVCRIGGDCIGIVLHDRDSESALISIENIQYEISQFEYSEYNIHLCCTASVGIVCMHQSMESNSEQLLNNLYASLQEAKAQGPNTIVVYAKDEASVKFRRSQMQTVADIVLALEAHRLVLFRQKVTSINAQNDTSYYEILMRIKGANGEYIPPGRFIQAAERFHLMRRIDRSVLDYVVDCQLQHGTDSPCYSVNLSGATLSDEQFIEHIDVVFGNSQLDHEKLSFEITETDVVKNFDVANKVIRKLRSYGCKIALDDFGAGMSSYTYLAGLDIDIIKIDGSLVRQIAKKPANQSIIRSIVSLANDLKVKTVAEYVETKEELALLQDVGVDFVQGFYLDRPSLVYEPATDFTSTVTHVENVAESIKLKLLETSGISKHTQD